jgi:hypothetical protein
MGLCEIISNNALLILCILHKTSLMIYNMQIITLCFYIPQHIYSHKDYVSNM